MRNKKIIISEPFENAFAKLPKEIRDLVYQKIQLFQISPFHPSLRVKKMKGTQAIWEMSISMNYRLTFENRETGILLRKIGTHDILRSP